MKKLILARLDWVLGLGLLGYGFFLLLNYWGAYPTYGWGIEPDLSIPGSSGFQQNIKSIWFPFLLLFLSIWGGLTWKGRKVSIFGLTLCLWLGLAGFLLLSGLLQSGNIFEEISFLGMLFKVLLTTGIILLGVVVFTILLIGFGLVLMRFFGVPKVSSNFWHKILLSIHVKDDSEAEDSGLQYWLYFFMGFICLSFLVFLLTTLDLFILPVLVTFLAFIVIYFWKEFREILSNFFVHRIELSSWQTVVLAIVFGITILNIAQSFFPFSLGWDTSNHYLLTTKILMETGELRTGIYPAFMEMVLSVFGKFTGLSGVQFLIVFWGSFLPLSLYMLGRMFKLSESLNLLLVLSFFLLPAVQFQLSKDLKLDIIFCQLIITILAYLPKRKAMFLLGFAPLAKLTAFGFFPVAIGVSFWKRGRCKIKAILVSMGLLFLPFSIYAGMNLWAHGSIPKTMGQWQSVLLKGENLQPLVHIPQVISAKPNWVVSTEKIVSSKDKKYVSTSFEEEIGRYAGFESNLFKKLWAVFLSPNIPKLNKQYVDLGFIWIFLLPFFVWSFFVAFKKKKKSLLFYFLAITFFFLWLFILGGVAWYSLPFILLVFVLGGGFFTKEKDMYYTYKVFHFFLFISVLFGLWGFGLHVSQSSIKTTLSWAVDPTTKTAEQLSRLYHGEARSVADIMNIDTQKKILRVGTFAKFWLDQPDRRVIEDPQLDILGRMMHGRSNQAILQILKDNKITYLLFDRGTMSIETNKKGTLHQKVAQIDSFIQEMRKQQKIKILFWGKRIILVQLST